MFLVLLIMCSLALDDPFLVVFSFENLSVLCIRSFLPSQDLLPVIYIISFMIGTPTNGLAILW